MPGTNETEAQKTKRLVKEAKARKEAIRRARKTVGMMRATEIEGLGFTMPETGTEWTDDDVLAIVAERAAAAEREASRLEFHEFLRVAFDEALDSKSARNLCRHIVETSAWAPFSIEVRKSVKREAGTAREHLALEPVGTVSRLLLVDPSSDKSTPLVLKFEGRKFSVALEEIVVDSGEFSDSCSTVITGGSSTTKALRVWDRLASLIGFTRSERATKARALDAEELADERAMKRLQERAKARKAEKEKLRG